MNHQYMIALEEYSESGYLTGKMTYVYKDNPVDFAHAVKSYKDMKHTGTDENGNVVETSISKYNVTPQLLCYETIEDMDAFKAVNHISI